MKQISRKPFGSTGHLSSRVVFGGAAFSHTSQDEADQTMRLLLKYGVNHIDVASAYGDGHAERCLKPWMQSHRDSFFLATKVKSRTKDAARSEFEGSLKRMGVDSVDLLQIHRLIDPEEWEVALGPGGALEALIELREEGLIRFIGITGHGMEAPRTHLEALKRFPFDSVLAAYNWLLSQDSEYKRLFDALSAECSGRKIALQTIKSMARRPWPREKQPGPWYQPLTRPEHIELATRWILSHPEQFAIAVGDITVLPDLLQAAADFAPEESASSPERPSDEDMRQLAEQVGMEHIFDGRVALMKE